MNRLVSGRDAREVSPAVRLPWNSRMAYRVGFGFVLASVLTLGISMRPAVGVQATSNQAKLGTWELSLGNSGDFKAPVTLVRRAGNRVFGVIEWRSDGPSKTLELFSATIDPASGHLRFDGREEHSKADGMFPAVYEGKLGADGRSLTGFRSTSLGTTGATGTMTWVKEEVTSYPPTIMASLNLPDERTLLYQQLSAHYVLQGIPVRIGPDRPLMKELSRSKEKHVRDLADLMVTFQELFDQAKTKDAKEAQNLAKDDLDRRSKIFKFTAESLAKDDALGQLKLCANLLNSVGLKKGFDRRRSEVELACVQMAVINHVRLDLRAAYEARSRGKQTFERGKLTAGFKVNALGRGILTLANKTGGDLHNVFVATEMKVDQKKVDQEEREGAGQEKAAGMINVALGIDPKIIVSINNLEEVLFGYHRIDKGASTFIPLWPKGTPLEVEIAMPGDIQFLAASLGAWVGSDEGTAPLSLDLDEVKRMIPEPLDKKPRSTKKKR